MKVYRTKYDGCYIVVNEKGDIFTYEGISLAPEKNQREIRRAIEGGSVKELDCFCMEALRYGYV